MRKYLVVGIIVLFIGVGVQPVLSVNSSANNISTNKGRIEEDNELYNGNYGYILCKCEQEEAFEIRPFPWAPLICKDLDTGQIKHGICNIFGINRFIFLPKGHDYLISENLLWFSAPDVLIEDLGDMGYAYFYMEPHYSRILDNSFIETFPLLNLLLQRLRI